MLRADFTGLRIQSTTRRRHSELIHQCDEPNAAHRSIFVRAVLFLSARACPAPWQSSSYLPTRWANR